MVYKGIVKGNAVVLKDGLTLPEGTEVEVTPLEETAKTGLMAQDLQEREALGAKMEAFSQRLAARNINLSQLVIEGRKELEERA